MKLREVLLKLQMKKNLGNVANSANSLSPRARIVIVGIGRSVTLNELGIQVVGLMRSVELYPIR